MDHERAIQNGMTSELRQSTPLYCKKHVEDDITRQMNKLKSSAAVQQTIMADIFLVNIQRKRRVLLILMTKMSLYSTYSKFIQSGTT